MMNPQPQHHTVAVHNFKDDPTGEAITLHGLYTAETLPAAEDFLRALREANLTDFLDATVVPIRPATIEGVVTAQGLGPSFLPATPTV